MKLLLINIFTLSLLLFACNQQNIESTETIIDDFNDYTVMNDSIFNLEEIDIGTKLENPWAIQFINDDEIIITEKKGNLIYANLSQNYHRVIKHEIPLIKHGQGGLLDIKMYKEYLYISFTIQDDNGKFSTAIGRGKFTENYEALKDFEILFKAEPFYKSGKHFGSRLIIKDDYIYATIGERGQGDVSQNLDSHAGSIIRINLDGTVPSNPYDNNLKEIYMIGVRNPQGMALSKEEELIISNHGAKGGDFIGFVEGGANYGWNKIGWGGTNYSGTKIGDGSPFNEDYKYPILSWVPSIAPSDLIFYYGKEFPEWGGDILVTSLKYKLLIRLDYDDGKITNKEIIFKDKIGRLRDVDINSKGEIYLITDEPNSSIWKLTSN